MKRLLDGKFHEEVADDEEEDKVVEIKAMAE